MRVDGLFTCTALPPVCIHIEYFCDQSGDLNSGWAPEGFQIFNWADAFLSWEWLYLVRLETPAACYSAVFGETSVQLQLILNCHCEKLKYATRTVILLNESLFCCVEE